MAAKIIEQERGAVLMWAIDHARREYEDHKTGGKEFARLSAPLRAATRNYVREDSTLHNWLEEREMVEQADLDIDLCEALDQFLAYAKLKNDASAQRWKRATFKQALKAACPSIEFDER